MRLENQVVSLEIAKKLKELGVKQESLFYHYCNMVGNFEDMRKHWSEFIPASKDFSEWFREERIHAYTVAELGEMLPDNFSISKLKDKWICSHMRYDGAVKSYQLIERERNNEADARGKMLIYLFENVLQQPEVK